MGNDDFSKLTHEEAMLRLYWDDAVEHIKRDIAYIWTDEVREDFAKIKIGAGKIAFILRKIHSFYRSDTTRYEKEIADIRNVIKHLNNIESKEEWIERIQWWLNRIIGNINMDITFVKNSLNYTEKDYIRFSEALGRYYNRNYSRKIQEKIDMAISNIREKKNRLEVRNSVHMIQDLGDSHHSLEALGKIISETQNEAYRVRLRAIQQKYEFRLVACETILDLSRISNYMKRVLSFLSYSGNVNPEIFLNASDFILKGEIEIKGYSNSEKEVGGLLLAKPEYLEGRKIIFIELKKTSEGDERSIRVDSHGFSGNSIGLWHTHPNLPKINAKGIPIPSADDLLTPYFLFSFWPHMIIAPNQARFYIPEFLVDLLDSDFKNKFVPYTREARTNELVKVYHWSKESAEPGSHACQSLMYFPFFYQN